MLWERAKNLTLIFFLLLNIGLACFLLPEINRYSLTDAQVNAVYQVLSQNRIGNYSKPLRQYPPMRSLMVTGYAYDIEAMLPFLFDDAANVERYYDSGKEDYTDGVAWLNLSNGYISYDNPSGLTGTECAPFDRDAAARICDEFVAAHFKDFKQDDLLEADNGVRLVYRQQYQKYIVYTNFIELLITENGIEQLDIQYSPIARFDGTAQPICSSDEALLTFVQRIRVIYGETPVMITRMDIVYYQEEYSLQEDVPLQAAPYYRIFIEKQEVPFLINAYTNTFR